MGLIDLKTDLKSLKYSKDRIGGGSSNQPFVQKPIPDGFSAVGNTGGLDVLTRGGSLVFQKTADDISRLSKLLLTANTFQGPAFTIKQNVLSRQNVRTQASPKALNQGPYLPTSTIAQAAISATGLHFNTFGLNPVPGTLGSLTTYSDVVSYDQPSAANRLVDLTDSFVTGRSFSNTLYSYSGGPGSILGVGNTNIKFASTNLGGTLRTLYSPSTQNPLNNYGNTNFLTTGYDGFRVLSTPIVAPSPSPESGTTPPGKQTPGTLTSTNFGLNSVPVKAKSTNKSSFYNNGVRNNSKYTAELGDFRVNLRGLLKGQSTIISDAPNYKEQNIETRTSIGGTATQQGPGYRAQKNLISYTKGSGIGPIDRINALPIYRSEYVDTNQPVNDLVKFRIAAIDNTNPTLKDFIHFRAFLDSFSDNYSADWNSVNYLGRGENFYSYKGFSRTISMGWTVAAQSKEEIMMMYKKLNFLASNLAPSYTTKGYMTGNLVQLTVGGYLLEQVGFITGLTYDVPMESPWEIAITDTGAEDPALKEVPHIIKVTGFSFTPIQEFIPSKQTVSDFKKDPNSPPRTISNSKGFANAYGSQRFISLSTAGQTATQYNSYDNPSGEGV